MILSDNSVCSVLKQDGNSLCRPGWPETHHVKQAELRLAVSLFLLFPSPRVTGVSHHTFTLEKSIEYAKKNRHQFCAAPPVHKDIFRFFILQGHYYTKQGRLSTERKIVN